MSFSQSSYETEWGLLDEGRIIYAGNLYCGNENNEKRRDLWPRKPMWNIRE